MDFDRIRNLYRNYIKGVKPWITEKGLTKAVELGWITEEQKQLILAENEEG